MVSISSDDFLLPQHTYRLTADSSGLQKLSVSFKSIEGEISEDNNYYEDYIEVIDDQKKVLILSDYAHPDIGALRQALESSNNYDVEVKSLKQLKSEYFRFQPYCPFSAANSKKNKWQDF